jgi:hypothetical protein
VGPHGEIASVFIRADRRGADQMNRMNTFIDEARSRFAPVTAATAL